MELEGKLLVAESSINIHLKTKLLKSFEIE